MGKMEKIKIFSIYSKTLFFQINFALDKNGQKWKTLLF